MSYQWSATEPQRLDVFLVDQNPEVSRSRIQKSIERGDIEVNGEEVLRPALMLKSGDTVFFDGEWDVRDTASSLEPANLDLTVLYEDDECMVIDKPSGYAVHPGHGMGPEEKTILHGIAWLFRERSLPFSNDAVLVHRLDKDTTGCLLIAKTQRAHQLLQEQFEQRDVSKTYLAITAGIPDPPVAVIDAPIGRSLNDRTKMSVLRTSKSREAKTTYRVRSAGSDIALVECDLHTGRTHQVRVHLSSIGYPILGDPAYRTQHSVDLSHKYGAGHLCLHAWKLTFVSPTFLREIPTEAQVPSSMLRVCAAAGIDLLG